MLNKEDFNKSKKCSQYLVLSEAERNELQVYPKEAFKQVHWSKIFDEQAYAPKVKFVPINVSFIFFHFLQQYYARRRQTHTRRCPWKSFFTICTSQPVVGKK